MTTSYRFVVAGRVQGVGFRQATRHQALKLGLQGWVRNCADGTVEGWACGSDAALIALRRWLNSGPPAAQVTQLQWTAASGAAAAPGFRIER
ncbi:MAG: acylphosphatase [Nevskia sp.]|nr:acylphosphatase [Nevskia sp.]